MQSCCTCSVKKLMSEFHADASQACGVSKRCKDCKRLSDKKHRLDNIDKKRAKDKKYYAENAETIKARAKEWYDHNIDRAKASRHDWYERNFEKVKVARQKWLEEHVDFMNEYMKTYQRDRYRMNMDYKLKTILNARIRACLCKKSKATLEFVGCTLDVLKRWMEFQFDEHMSWENIGTFWHIDHVKPCNIFDFTNDKELQECFHWSNLRPLEKHENISKGAKVIPTVIEFQEKKAIQFLSM